MKWFYNILDVWKNELIRSLTDIGALVFFVLVPLLYPPLYAYLYNNESVREVPTVVVDNCHTSMSRDFLRKADASGDINIIGHCADMQEAIELIHEHKAYCLIYVPAEFQKNIAEGKQAVVELYSDMSGLLYYKSVLSACTEVSLEMNQEIKAQRLVGATKEQAEAFAYPIKYEYVPMFNTQSGFATFLIPAVMMMIIQQTMLLGIGMLLGDERENKRKGIIAEHLKGKRPLEILIGKATGYFKIRLVHRKVAVAVLIAPERHLHAVRRNALEHEMHPDFTHVALHDVERHIRRHLRGGALRYRPWLHLDMQTGRCGGHECRQDCRQYSH